MRKVKRWRFYCDHCNKGGCSGGHMKKHETGCCRNPNRVCGMCKVAELEQQPIDDLIAALKMDGGLNLLRTLAGGCPACMLAAVLQDRIRRDVDGYEEGEPWFDFKAESKRFWSDVNEAHYNFAGGAY